MTRQQFLAAHPTFAALQGDSDRVRYFLQNHPDIAQAWSQIIAAERTGTTSAAAPATAPATATGAPAPTGPTPGQQNAYDLLMGAFTQYGLGGLGPTVWNYVIQGYGADTIDLLVRQTPEFKTRFAANEQRLKAGLTPLSIDKYLQLENSYRQVLSSAGLPSGFYDSNDDFTGWIAGDVSPDEIKHRVDMANGFVQSTDPSARSALQQYYNIGDGELIAYFLDQKRATPVLERQAAAAAIGGAAIRQGLSIGVDRAEQFASTGAAGQADQAYSTIAELLPSANKLSDIYGGEDYRQTDAEDELLGGLASARRKRTKLSELEQNNFSGNGGASTKSLGKSTAGSY